VKPAKLLFFLGAIALTPFLAQAQPDYAPALWQPAYPGHWYTGGNSHSFCVIHDMEGYYQATISYFQQSGTQASVHYCVNGLKDNSSDAPAGEITQMVREQYWAWHVLCWNLYTYGTEHEGFVSNPAWYTEAMYQASAGLQRHLCATTSIPMDRNHIIGHNEWQNSTWTSWMAMPANWPQIDTTCNNHTDPGQYWDWTHFMSLISTNGPPAFTLQPLNRSVNQGTNVTFTASGTSTAPFTYQWRKNGLNIAGATTSAYALGNVQTNADGGYSVVLTSTNGTATSATATLYVNPTVLWQVVFSDDFETNSSSRWNLFQGSTDNISDYTANWAFDYSTTKYIANGVTNNIPAAPNSVGGVKHGLKLTVNKNDANAADSGVSLYPTGLSFTGNYALRFDMWMNYAGGVGGGTGSTEYATFGINHTGTRVNWGAGTNSASDGLWFACAGEGGAVNDYSAYVGNPSGNPTQLTYPANGLSANGASSADAGDPFYRGLFPSPTYETAGAPGKHWVQGEVSQVNNVLTWRLNGVVVSQRTNSSSFTSGDIMIGYMDTFPSIASPPQDDFVIFDNIQVLTPAVAPAILLQPAPVTANVGAHATFTVGASGSPRFYQWRFNGVNIAGATTSTYTQGNLVAGNAGNYSVVVTNIAGIATSTNAALTVTRLQMALPTFTTDHLFQINATGAPGSGYTIQTSSNLVDWLPLVTLTNTNGTIQYVDGVNTNNPQLFYRIIAPQ
jgi:hypothetical protein